ncbi:MAG: tetratricopeptide repeat protein [Planctomycetes bacterium]|nr:tetratricopeptide repeat protein [Planctomycetota bacterium]
MTRANGKFRAAAARILACAAGLIVLSGCEQPQQTTKSQIPPQDQTPRETEVRPDQPPTAKTLYSMAQILAAQGKDKECEFVLRRCLQEYPRFTPAHNSLAELQMRQGRVHEAVAMLSKALEIRPQDPVLLNNLGMCLLLRKEYAPALDRFTQASGLVPENEKYRANMATALGLLGREEEAQALFEQTLTIEKAKHNVEILRKARERQADPPAAPG